ncbi:MAG TPA: cupredoxin domain-containing protein [Longimicrobiales bacterium]|nr:cupredoxin domain-containing protein [Longimicrobiales bacterium]
MEQDHVGSARNPGRRPVRTLTLAGLGVLVVVLLALGSGSVWHGATARGSGQRVSLAAAHPESFTISLKGEAKLAPDGERYDAFSMTEFTVRAGVPVTMTIYNYDDMPHSFTSPRLGVDHMVASGEEDAPSVTRFTFTPTKAGTYWWYCATPCDEWAMTHIGYMIGKITVTD